MIIFIVDIMPKLQVRESLHLFPPFTLFEVERSRFCTLRHFELAPNRRGHFFGAAPLRDQRARRSYLTFARVIVYGDLRQRYSCSAQCFYGWLGWPFLSFFPFATYDFLPDNKLRNEPRSVSVVSDIMSYESGDATGGVVFAAE